RSLSCLSMCRRQPSSTFFPYTTIFRSLRYPIQAFTALIFPYCMCFLPFAEWELVRSCFRALLRIGPVGVFAGLYSALYRFYPRLDRKSTRLNSSHVKISYAVFCLKKKK